MDSKTGWGRTTLYHEPRIFAAKWGILMGARIMTGVRRPVIQCKGRNTTGGRCPFLCFAARLRNFGYGVWPVCESISFPGLRNQCVGSDLSSCRTGHRALLDSTCTQGTILLLFHRWLVCPVFLAFLVLPSGGFF